ncbi:XRE family transcriptional regulator [Pseudomonas palleroniana]|uniref:XRE family transcriptional regulator n=1 Tax=Pseudomonas palleroniana TaxID=191390 RepID=A0A2L1JB26_9PSED|nr:MULTISPECIES: helix-turn-helix transcriptional regulator [Pseudomonas]AVE05692.1 XRE family transcriptional regulator [Pseudomonas palleroniana]
MDIGVAFGKVLRQKRRDAGLTQEQLAHEADVQRNYVSLIERGIHHPTIAVVFKLAHALRCPPSVLISDLEKAVSDTPESN